MDNLVIRCQQGELAAFGELFKAYESRAYRLALTILGDEADAQDAVQDVFLRVFEQIKNYQGKSSFQTWLTTIVVNMCRDKLRRRKVRQALSLDWLRGWAGQSNVAEDVAAEQERQHLWAFVNELDDKYRLPLILHYYEDLACDEVAKILNVPVATIYARLNGARLRLRAAVQNQDGLLPGREKIIT